MDVVWKALCQIAATFSLGCSMTLIGPFMYHASSHFNHFSYGEFFAYIIGGRGVGMVTGVVIGVFLPVKYNYSFLTCLLLLFIAIAAAAVPWLNGSMVLVPTIIGLGFAAGATKICTQNLFKIYHSHASPSNKLHKLMHISFAFGCFFALTSVFLFSDVSMYQNPHLSSLDASRHPVVSFHSSAGPNRTLLKRSLELVSNSSVLEGNATALPTTSTPSTLSTPITIKTSLAVETTNTSNNDSSLFFNSTKIVVTRHDNSTKFLTLEPVTTEPLPMKPDVVDANNGKHSKDGASGNKINNELKENLKNNPLGAAPAEPLPSPPATTVTQPPSSTLMKASTQLNASSTSIVFYNNSAANVSNFSTGMTVSASSSLQAGLPATSTSPIKFSHSGSSDLNFSISAAMITTASKTAAIKPGDELAQVNQTTKLILSTSLFTPEPPSNSSLIPTSVSSMNSLPKLSSYPTTQMPSSGITTSTELSSRVINNLSTTAVSHSSLSSSLPFSFFPTLSSSSLPFTDRVSDSSEVGKKSRYLKVTDLDSLMKIVNNLQFHFQGHAVGFFIVSAVICIASSMFAINSGLCWKSKSDKSFSDISYSCPDKDSIPARKLTYLRVAISMFSVAYNSAEVILASLLASYLCSFDEVTLSMGILGSCMFWLWFFLGRLAFAILSGYFRLYYLAFLSCSLSLFCLIFFHFATSLSFHISWHFLATVLSATGFFFSMINPSFNEYREVFPLLACNTNAQEMILPFGELFIPIIVCCLVFSSGAQHFIYSMIMIIVACFFALIFLKVTNSSFLAKKSLRRRNSLSCETWCKNTDDMEVDTLSFDGNSTVKPLLNP